MAPNYNGIKRNQQVHCDKILEEKLLSKLKSIDTEFNLDLRTLRLVAVAPLSHFGVNTATDVDDRINMSGFENISPEPRHIPKLQSLRCEV